MLSLSNLGFSEYAEIPHMTNSEILRLVFKDMFLRNTRHLLVCEINEPTLGSSGGGGCTVRSAGS